MRPTFRIHPLAVALTIVTIVITATFFVLRSRTMVHRFSERPGDYVVLLHGLGRTALAMEPMGAYLTSRGYTVVNIGYPSAAMPIEELADSLVTPAILEHCTDTTRSIHFVSHSMGGIVARVVMNDARVASRIGRAVMLAPPNAGSELADMFGEQPWAQWLMGPALTQLSARPGSMVNRLGPVPAETGVIAGNRAGLWPGGWILEGADDGIVRVARARVDGMRDFAVVPCTHTFVINDPDVLELTCRFLEKGAFVE